MRQDDLFLCREGGGVSLVWRQPSAIRPEIALADDMFCLPVPALGRNRGTAVVLLKKEQVDLLVRIDLPGRRETSCVSRPTGLYGLVPQGRQAVQHASGWSHPIRLREEGDFLCAAIDLVSAKGTT